ncbi:hypothetical protein PT974_06755 [Cladobotryum mycophilum]|uniref:GAR domain-containing protein n=1 Tax=Cladobotryum mycophilum TaxID=491253 RepID=A0ABR0SMC5_9HYPO
MSDPPFLVRPSRLSPGTPGTLLSTRSRPADDFLDHIEPATVVDALALPTGGLRSCLDGASASEEDFAMRTAMASQSIWEWLNELQGWNWPAEGGSEGFENLNRTRRKLFVKITSPDDSAREYVGCLLVGDVTNYERRIEEINRDLDGLDLEEIKGLVMTDHIMPLSRPTTPVMDPNQSFLSSLMASCTKMNDLSAVVTAIVLQTLPNLARLSHLLHVWSVRINVLQQVEPLLLAISDAEILLQENWVALSKFPQNITSQITKHNTRIEFKMTRMDFEARKEMLAQKVAQPGRTLDFMLDCLEGSPDTLPEEWLNRMEDVEQGYGEWVAACERRINEAEWNKPIRSRDSTRSPLSRSPFSPEGRQPRDDHTGRAGGGAPTTDLSSGTITVPVPHRPIVNRFLSQEQEQDSMDLSDSTETESLFEHNIPSGDESELLHSPIANKDGAQEGGVRLPRSRPLYKFDDEFDETLEKEQRGGAKIWPPLDDYPLIDDAMTTVDEETEEEEEEMELPPLRSSTRRDSSVSQTSTVVRNVSRYFDDFSSDFPEVSASPAVRKSRLREALYPEDYSPPSSPPEAGRHRELALLDSPLITSIPEDDSLLNVGLDGEFYDDFDDSFAISDMGEPRYHRESMGDIQLREQISQIIGSIPARINLSNGPSTINLNPPDLQLPRLRKKSSKEPIKRPSSGLSTRTATPSFTLSPAKGPRSRNRGGHQEIKVYHLSRNGDAPIKLFIRCVGEHGERVMVRVGGGWADLGEYLKEYASHHGRRSTGKDQAHKVEIKKLTRAHTMGYIPTGSSPPSRPGSAAGEKSPITPLNVRKARKSLSAVGTEVPRAFRPNTPGSSSLAQLETPPSDGSGRSRSSSRSWMEDESSFLGLAGPTGKKIEMSEESKAWVESVKEKVRRSSGHIGPKASDRFGELGKVGGTKRVFRKG